MAPRTRWADQLSPGITTSRSRKTPMLPRTSAATRQNATNTPWTTARMPVIAGCVVTDRRRSTTSTILSIDAVAQSFRLSGPSSGDGVPEGGAAGVLMQRILPTAMPEGLLRGGGRIRSGG